MSTRESGSSTQSTGTSWIRRPIRSASDEQLGVEEPLLVPHEGQQPEGDVAAERLETALGVAEAAAQEQVEERVVAAGDELADRAADHPRPRGEPGPDGDVAVPRDERRDQRQQRVEPGRQVDVEIGDDGGIARTSTRRAAPGPGPSASRWRARTPTSALARAAALSQVPSVLALSAMVIRAVRGNSRFTKSYSARTLDSIWATSL